MLAKEVSDIFFRPVRVSAGEERGDVGRVAVSLPERRYALLAEMLIRAVLTSEPSEPARHATMRIATETGHQLGEHVRVERRLGRLGPERALTAAAEVLEDYGYEPDCATGSIMLRNCPFARLASSAPELVCTLNQHLIAGLLTGLGAAQRLRAALIPTGVGCCVQVHTDHLATPPPTG